MSQQVEDWEEQKPDEIAEMPEDAAGLDILETVLPEAPPFQLAGEVGKNQHRHEHVNEMETGQGEVEGEERVVSEGGSVLDFLGVFDALEKQEGEPGDDGTDHPTDRKRRAVPAEFLKTASHEPATCQEDERVGKGERLIEKVASLRKQSGFRATLVEKHSESCTEGDDFKEDDDPDQHSTWRLEPAPIFGW